MIVKIIVLCMVGVLIQVNATKWNELLEKKHKFVFNSKSFPFYDFEKISAILGNNTEIVGKNLGKEKEEWDTKHGFPAMAEDSVQLIFKPQPFT